MRYLLHLFVIISAFAVCSACCHKPATIKPIELAPICCGLDPSDENCAACACANGDSLACDGEIY